MKIFFLTLLKVAAKTRFCCCKKCQTSRKAVVQLLSCC